MEYILKNEYLTVAFQSLGGALHSIQDTDGVEYLWQGDKNYWSGQAPVLFPICGSIRNDKAQIGTGKVAQMSRHGIVRKREFKCLEQKGSSILFSLESSEEMYEQYPYHFRLGIRYTLTGNMIETEYLVENMGQTEMPFFIGGHPGFNCPLFPGEDYNEYFLEFEQEETCSVPTPVTETGLIDMGKRTEFLKSQKILNLDHSLFAVDAVILDEIRSRRVALKSAGHGKGVTLDFQDFPYLILWSTANEGPFIALEPWMGLSTCSDESDVFEEKRNVQKAKPGECRTYSFRIQIS